MNEAQRKKFEEEWDKKQFVVDDNFGNQYAVINHRDLVSLVDSVLSVSDGLEHSQHKCGCEEVIKAYREELERISANEEWDEEPSKIAREVLTRMEGKG